MAGNGDQFGSLRRNLGNDPYGARALDRRNILFGSSSLVTAAVLGSTMGPPQTAPAQAQQPTFSPTKSLGDLGDDIGTWKISFNSRGMMGYITPEDLKDDARQVLREAEEIARAHLIDAASSPDAS